MAESALAEAHQALRSIRRELERLDGIVAAEERDRVREQLADAEARERRIGADLFAALARLDTAEVLTRGLVSALEQAAGLLEQVAQADNPNGFTRAARVAGDVAGRCRRELARTQHHQEEHHA